MFHELQNKTNSPFALCSGTEGRTLVAIKGVRKGYLQLATYQLIENYAELPLSLLEAAKAWASTLENNGVPRVYWITLSEMVTHLHIHLYPRFTEDTVKGTALFDERDKLPQPVWDDPFESALQAWAKQYDVHIISN